ncbi:EAL domain-containing protein [Bacillus sp. FJAT-45037]|uniref:EAL domain-containing protein n=1 Tax=Bacillus sp. FJAT-45037 TaxID=2011007 RepID=UPI0012FD9A2A|nr:EAL domain-containing protein [Bacillus sp. FJAT-45037]
MNSCKNCGFIPNLSDRGHLLLRIKNQNLLSKMKGILLEQNMTFTTNENNLLFVQYDSLQHVQTMIDLFDSYLLKKADQVYATYSVETNDRFANFVPYEQLRERLLNWSYVQIINEGLFTQHMQPIINVSSGSVYGYEFLLRPIDEEHRFNPGSLFSFSQRAGLQSVLDSQARISAIKISAKHLSKGVKRFINFLPSSIYDPNHCLKSTLQAVERANIDPEDLVFEVVETEKIPDIDQLKNIFNVYQKRGIHVALDDLGSGFATVDVLKELKPNFAKIDRNLIGHCDEDPIKQREIKEIANVANTYGITLLAEGIERKEEADFCAHLHIPLAQGYYFGRPEAKPRESLHI